jgi:glycosyltransferase involved in cell wall biosynthesis
MSICDISIILGSKNRKQLLKATIESIRNNGFKGTYEIIVVDGGSTDGTCDWLAKQRDIFTIIQPNYRIIDQEGISVLAHSWGEFMNVGFKYANTPWIVMVSDDLILAKGTLQKGYDELVNRMKRGERIGGGAFYFREYPRHSYYRVGIVAYDYITINHGFYNKEALKEVNFIDEKGYNFYCADGDLTIRLNEAGWKTIALEDCFADHLVHKPVFRKMKYSPSTQRDIDVFNKKYPLSYSSSILKKELNGSTNGRYFWKVAFMNCIFGLFLKYYDKKVSRNGK